MINNKQSAIYGNFWQIVDLAKKFVSDYEKLIENDKFIKELPLVEIAYIHSIIIQVGKIVSSSKKEEFRLDEFKKICRPEIQNELNRIKIEYKFIIGKINTNRNKLIAHLDKDFYKLYFSENEILRMEQQKEKVGRISLEESKNIYALMPRTEDKTKERYSVGDFRDDFPYVKKMLYKIDDIWNRSIPLV